MSASVATADTGGYVRVKGFDSHFQSLGFNQLGCTRTGGAVSPNKTTNCKFADEKHDLPNVTAQRHDNELHWNSDDGEGLVVGADFGFFRLEVEGTYQDGAAVSWRGHTATGHYAHGQNYGPIRSLVQVDVFVYQYLTTRGSGKIDRRLPKCAPATGLWGFGAPKL